MAQAPIELAHFKFESVQGVEPSSGTSPACLAVTGEQGPGSI